MCRRENSVGKWGWNFEIEKSEGRQTLSQTERKNSRDIVRRENLRDTERERKKNFRREGETSIERQRDYVRGEIMCSVEILFQQEGRFILLLVDHFPFPFCVLMSSHFKCLLVHPLSLPSILSPTLFLFFFSVFTDRETEGSFQVQVFSLRKKFSHDGDDVCLLDPFQFLRSSRSFVHSFFLPSLSVPFPFFLSRIHFPFFFSFFSHILTPIPSFCCNYVNYNDIFSLPFIDSRFSVTSFLSFLFVFFLRSSFPICVGNKSSFATTFPSLSFRFPFLPSSSFLSRFF